MRRILVIWLLTGGFVDERDRAEKLADALLENFTIGFRENGAN